MIRRFLIAFFVIYSIKSNPINRNGNETCELEGYFVPENGYGWAKLDNRIICTCPDTLYTVNKPCRICNRDDICGLSDALCSEELDVPSTTAFFGCFCPGGSYILGEKCSQDSVTVTPVTTTQMITSPISTATPIPGTTTTSIVPAATTTTTMEPESTTTTLPATTTTIQITTITTTNTTTTKEATTTTTTPCGPQSSGPRILLQPALIILLNLIYFYTK
ncbi:hypothetical protein I4U23_018584 [Adineta vaga]|nr:hypothetical protein I4U23_018584 [Adineta vaga]